MVRLQLSFVSYFCIYANGNQNSYDCKLTAVFAELNYLFMCKYIILITGLLCSVHINMNFLECRIKQTGETFEKKVYHQCTVENYQCVQDAGLQ